MAESDNECGAFCLLTVSFSCSSARDEMEATVTESPFGHLRSSLMSVTLVASATARLTTVVGGAVGASGDFRGPFGVNDALPCVLVAPRTRFVGLAIRSWLVLAEAALPSCAWGEFASDGAGLPAVTGAVEKLEFRSGWGFGPVMVVGLGGNSFGLLIDLSTTAPRSAGWVTISRTFPTDALNLLYKPLSPPCSSPAIPFPSPPDEDEGGDVYSLKVVRVSV